MAPETTAGEMRARDADTSMKIYWQPGCSSCLKTKEFLLANGVEFESINVIDDETGFKELAALGLKLVPIVARGKDWANGAVFRVVGFEWRGHDMLSPEEMVDRIDGILAGARRLALQIRDPRHSKASYRLGAQSLRRDLQPGK